MALALAISLATDASGQEDRADLIERARVEHDLRTAMDLFMAAADPSVAPLDSVWADGVHQLASALLALPEPQLGDVWLRWVARHGEAWLMDERTFRPAVLEAFHNARSFVRSHEGGEAPSVRTHWRWPSRFEADAAGGVEVTAFDDRGRVPVTVEVRPLDDRPMPPAGRLPPGSYQIAVSAEGYEPVEVSREVLPGVTTLLELELLPSLAETALEGLAAAMIPITFDRAGVETCSDGIVAREGFVITALEVLDGAEDPQVVTAAGPVPVEWMSRDPSRGLALLWTDAPLAEPFPTSRSAGTEVFVWSVKRRSCDGPLGAERMRLPRPRPPGPAGQFLLEPPIDAGAVGAALVDRSGGLVGIVTRPESFASADVMQQALVESLSRRLAEQPVPEPSGGFPWRWVGAASAAGAVAVALVTSGNGGSSSGRGRGTIEVTIPGFRP